MQIYLNVCIHSLWATGEIFYAYNYRPQRSWAKVMFHGGVSASVHARIPPPSPRADNPQEQTPPREADSGIRSTSGRYASYWNAFLFYESLLIKLSISWLPEH